MNLNSKFLLAALGFVLLSSNFLVGQDIVWRDEFNGKQLDRNTWIHDVGGHGFGNAQLEFNTALSQNSYVKDGKLFLVARREKYSGREFTSARISTQGRFAFQYGSLVARIKVPDTADGIWPAFWLLGNNFPAVNWPRCGEADILEIGSKEGIAEGLQHRKINCALHFSDQAGKKKSLVKWHIAPSDLHRDFHLYQVDWTPKSMTFKLDGKTYGEWDLTAPEFREFHQPYFPILNVAVGSFQHTYTGIDTPEKVSANFPARMEVDWIRLHSNAHTKVIRGNDQALERKYGVYTEALMPKLAFETDKTKDFEYGQKARFNSWQNFKIGEVFGDAAEGQRHYRFQIGAGKWFGGGVLVPNYMNMSRFSDGNLNFSIRTRSQVPLRVGIKSSRGGESWLPLQTPQNELGFPRDGKWHLYQLPLNRFSNIDFHTVHQLFMIAGGETSESIQIEVDDIWWEQGPERTKAGKGNFGIFTTNKKHQTAGNFESEFDSGFYVWEDTMVSSKILGYENSPVMQLRSKNKPWTGAAFSPDAKYDLSIFDNPDAVLKFAIKTKTKKSFKIGMKSGNVEAVGQFWLEFKPGNDPNGFKRDGKWHVVSIPMASIAKEVDLKAVSHLFEFVSVDGAVEEIEFADIYLQNGNAK